MTLRSCSWLAMLALTLSNPTPTLAQSFLEIVGLSPYTQYQEFTTEHFRLVYQEGFEDFAKRAATHLEHSHRVLQPILRWTPRGRTDVIIADNEDSANGLASPALRIGMVLLATPPDHWMSTAYSDDWIKLLAFHEYTHYLNIDPTTEWMEIVRIFFGDVIRPNGLWPVWMLEGLAVYFETRTNKLGRGKHPYWESILRALELEGRLGTHANNGFTLDRLNGDFPYFPGDVSYLFGYHLWNQLENDEQKGELSMRSSHRVPYFIEGNQENVTGKGWPFFWNSFVNETKRRFQPQIEKIKAAGVTNHEIIVKPGYSAVGGVISPDGEWLAYTDTSLHDLPRLVVRNLKTGEEHRSREKVSGVGLWFTPDSKTVIYSSLTRIRGFYLFSDLYAFDFKNEADDRLTDGARARDPALSPDGKKVVYIKSERATHVIVVASLTQDDDEWKISDEKIIYRPKAYTILGSPRFTNDSEIIFSEQEIEKGAANLSKVSMNGSHSTLLSNGAMNTSPFVDWKSGRILFTSDITGVQNLYSLDRGKATRITNVLTGTNFAFTAPSGDLFGSLMTADGYAIAKYQGSTFRDEKLATHAAKAQYPESQRSEPAQTSAADDYSPWSSLLPRQWAPVGYVVSGSNSGTTIGGFLLGFDSTGKQQYLGTGAYHFKPKTLDGSLVYTLYYFRPSIDFAVGTYTTDIANDSTRAFYRRRTEASVTLTYPFYYTRSSLIPSVYSFVSWNRIHSLDDGQVARTSDFQFANPNVPGYGATLSYTNARITRLGFMPEFGHTARIAVENRLNTSDQYSLVKYLAYYTKYFGLPDHHVIQPRARWLGSTRPGGLDISFAEVQGKDRDDSLDRGTSLGLNGIGLRGYSNSFFFTRAAGVGSIDYHFPLNRSFKGDGTFPVFVKQLHGFIYGESAVLLSSRGNKPLYLPSVGGGMSVDTTLLVRAPVRFNLEYQYGTRKDRGGDSILFLSLESSGLF